MNGRLRKAAKAAPAVAAILAVVFIASWMVIARAERRWQERTRPRWLTVEASPVAVVGGLFELRVTLDPLPGPEKIACGLRWTAADRRVSGRLASSGPALETRGGETLTFAVPVRENERMRFVAAVIYLSPTGRWQDRSRGASTELIPVRKEGGRGGLPPPRLLTLHRVSTPEEDARAASARPAGGAANVILRPLLVAVLAAGGGLCAGVALRQGRARAAWAGLAVVLVLSSVLEALEAPQRITEWLRLAFMERDIYDFRRPLQGALAAVAAAGTAMLAVRLTAGALRSRDRRCLGAAAAGAVVYLAVTAVGMTSFHAVDVLRNWGVYGISPFHAARGAGAVLSLLAAFVALRATRRGPT